MLYEKSAFIVLFLFLLVKINQSEKQTKSLDYLKDYYEKQDTSSCINPFVDRSSNIKQIILIRHGEPDITRTGLFNKKEAMDFIQAYDSVNVLPLDPVPLCADDLGTDKIYFSNIPRAYSTAAYLYKDHHTKIEDARFREFERKIISFPNIKLPLNFWLISSRISWMLGLNDKDIETFKQARARARENARYLSEQAKAENIVILVAHGLHNRYVEKYLKKLGWEIIKKGGRGYASVNILAQLENE